MSFLSIVIAIILFFTIFFLVFYRCPIPLIRKSNEDYVYGPGFGRVMKITQEGDNIFIAIFLTPLDIHYQFSPLSGIIKDIKYDRTGKFSLAYELNKSNENEKAITTITNKHGDFTVYQIAGFLVRRITTFFDVGQKVECGEKMGLIHFGSRVDIIIPKKSKDTKYKDFILNVKEGDYVSGFNTLLGYYNLSNQHI